MALKTSRGIELLIKYLLNQEVKTNKVWKDGSSIYSKTVAYNPTEIIGEKGKEVNTLVPHNIANFKMCTSVQVFTSDGYVFPSGSGSTAVNTLTSVTRVTSSGINFRNVNNTWGTNRTFYFALEYIKTTD